MSQQTNDPHSVEFPPDWSFGSSTTSSPEKAPKLQAIGELTSNETSGSPASPIKTTSNTPGESNSLINYSMVDPGSKSNDFPTDENSHLQKLEENKNPSERNNIKINLDASGDEKTNLEDENGEEEDSTENQYGIISPQIYSQSDDNAVIQNDENPEEEDEVEENPEEEDEVKEIPAEFNQKFWNGKPEYVPTKQQEIEMNHQGSDEDELQVDDFNKSIFKPVEKPDDDTEEIH
ncbi:hypothetical protein TVAG_217020 [Trichomonas vaginalis G3]|uniref:Uncharacterized protein n=1 Tax=Trichomonas vaginalis (strain ATCC PRA-98 / G3) TaxID=412133 RepID=A2F537_TRIV3|nr:hypothetical protein TVAGG3_0540300 [Trichomonas vaginalis G3]EAX99980.1 hypothetical protein TVAG_217020 [Trichomonas vaginalis G3]KAI5519792.1 hypothetical protein TVAGG3_0540300 [Trichomonas vaginalis G3]|eukprot:XP_001312910.1 hypothetical protein [Trichomonas vaginalis G3]